MPPLLNSVLAQQESKPYAEKAVFSVGELVQVRDRPHTSWLSGVVTSVEPIEVQVDGWAIPMEFNFIRSSPKTFDNTFINTGRKTTECKWMCSYQLKHIIGSNGKMIEKIRRRFSAMNVQIHIIDSDSVTMSTVARLSIAEEEVANLATPWRTSVFDYQKLIQISGPAFWVKKAWQAIYQVQIDLCAVSAIWYRQRAERRRQNRRAYRQTAKRGRRTNIYEMTKNQHGANGSWYTRKYKNKGRDRTNSKNLKGKKHWNRPNRKHLRKAKRAKEYFVDTPVLRRCSF